MRKLLQPLSIKKNLIVFFLVLFILPFLALCLIWYAKSAEMMEESGIYYNEQLVQRVNMQLDEYFTGISADTRSLPGHPLIQEFIKADPNNSYEMFRLKGRFPIELVSNLRKDIAGFTILTAKGAAYGSPIQLPKDIEPFGSFQWTDNFKIAGMAEKDGVPVLIIYRIVMDNVSYEPAGSIIMALSFDQFVRIADIKPYGKHGSFAIADEQGQILYHTDRQKWGQFLPQFEQMNQESGRLEMKEPEGKKLLVYQVSKQTKFKIVSEISKYELLGGLIRLQLLTLLVGAVILGLAFLVFSRMFWEIKRLLGEIHMNRLREKELELKHRDSLMSALQSRINPHFLYNALEIINAYAIVAQVRPISRMTQHLSNLFRYSVSNPDQVVSLREELDHIRNYMMIQEQRYDNLQFVVNVDSDMLDKVYVYRLIVQPLVENAFQHAYEQHEITPSTIKITGVAEADAFALYIEDEGGGMPPELARKYNEAFETISENKMLQSGFSPFQRIGLWNVHARLRLGFGVPYGIHIIRSGEDGSIIRILLPYMTGVITPRLSERSI
ncbi:sensor histidine kinase [Paenibacillus sp. HJGM_3]|uniref:cache domain-containing sensor histidine kinase n=1 Tax=Paenibacillus sp. HJGM_3 TaxID=3379816 RepID=UPI00385C94EC